MPLDFQIQQTPFRFGLAEGTDPHQVPPGVLTTAENATWKQSGRLEKRFGTSEFATGIVGGGDLTAAARLFTRGNELCLINGTSIYTYGPSASSWSLVDAVPDVGMTWTSLIDSTAGVASCDQVLSGTTLVTAWVAGDARGTDAGNLYFQVQDTASGSLLKSPTLVKASCVGVRIVVLGTEFHIVTRSGANINASAYSLTTFAQAVQSNLRTDSVQTGWDVMVIDSTIVLAYESTAPALKLYSYTYAAGVYTQAATGGITGEAGSDHTSIAIDGASGEVLYVIYSRSSPNVRARIATANPSTLAQVTAPVDLEQSAVSDAGTYTGYRNVAVRRTSSTAAIACWTTLSSTTQTGRAASVPVSSTLTVSSNNKRGTWSSEMLCRPFLLGSKCYALLLDITDGPSGLYSSQTTTYLAEIETSAHGVGSNWVPHRYVGKVDIFIGGATAYSYLPTAIAVSATEARITSPFQSIAASTAYVWRCGVRQVSVTVGASLPLDLWRSVTVGAESYLAGACLGAYDGRLCFDYGANRCVPILGTAGTPGSLVTGSYTYASVPEYRSLAGMLHRGPTFTFPLPVAVSAGKMTLTIVSLDAQAKQDVANGGYVSSTNVLPETIAIYRTVVNGTTPQRRTIDPIDAVYTDSALAYAGSYVDTRADASISATSTVTLASRPAIYTAGGILDDYSPPASVTMFAHVDRLWVLAGDQKTWWYSKAFADDAGVAPGFHPNFRVVFNDVQTAGASMDDKAIFFSATGVRYMLGVGPGPNGLNTDFQVPTPIQTDVGCTNARSVVGTPDGVMFLSARGIYLLDRGLTLSWIGRPVKDTLAAFPNVTSAVLVAKHNQVRFTCNNAAGDRGVVLVYDYVEKQWSTFRHQVGGILGIYGTAYADACMYGGEWTFVTPSAQVCQESSTSYLDGGAVYISMTLETAWMNAAGPLAFQSVRTFQLHGTSYTDHDLTVSVGFDSDASYPQTATWLAETPVTAVGVEECSVTIGTRRKCNAIRFKVVDTSPSSGTIGTGRGPAFDMMGLEVGIKRGFGNAPATKRA